MFKTADKRLAAPLGQVEQFLVLRENQFAVSALERLKQPDGVSRQPIVTIYGPAGSGKSHLARQFLRERLRAQPALRTAQLTAAQFAADLAEASADETIPEFQQSHRELDLLICEDLSGIEGRPESQRQLLAAIDQLVAQGAQVVCTSCKPPGQLIEMSAKLVNRLHAGICAAIEPLCAASRFKLLMHFASALQIALAESSAQLIAQALEASPRELLATLRQLETVGQMQKHTLDREFTRRFLDGEVKAPGPSLISVARGVAEHFGISVESLRAPTRRQGAVFPRQCAMHLSRELTGEPLLAIAQFYGRQNHTTVVHASRRMRRQMADDPAIERQVLVIRQSIRGSVGPSRRSRSV